MEATADGPAGVRRPPCGKAEQLLGHLPAELLRFSKWTSCKMLVNPHGCFSNCFIKYANHQSLARWEASTGLFFDLCYITSKGRTNVSLRFRD